VADGGLANLLGEIEAERLRLRHLLAGGHPALLAARPPSGKWSVLENVRHLLFAQEAHLGRFLPGGRNLSPLGLPPTGMQGNRRVRAAGTAETADVNDVFDAWEASHAAVRVYLQSDAEQVQKALARNLRHLRAHVRVIERLLRQQ
jgi:hypothetical protein